MAIIQRGCCSAENSDTLDCDWMSVCIMAMQEKSDQRWSLESNSKDMPGPHADDLRHCYCVWKKYQGLNQVWTFSVATTSSHLHLLPSLPLFTLNCHLPYALHLSSSADFQPSPLWILVYSFGMLLGPAVVTKWWQLCPGSGLALIAFRTVGMLKVGGNWKIEKRQWVKRIQTTSVVSFNMDVISWQCETASLKLNLVY